MWLGLDQERRSEMVSDEFNVANELSTINQALADRRKVRLIMTGGQIDRSNRLLKLAEMGIITIVSDPGMLQRITKSGIYHRIEIEVDLFLHEESKDWHEYLAWYMHNHCTRSLLMD